MKLFMKNFEKMPERAYSQPNRKDVIDLDAAEPPPAIKKSSISLTDIQPKAVKKSSLSISDPCETELVLTSKTKDQDRLSKFIKLEKNDKMSRIKKSEDSRLTSLVKMRAKFCNTKGSSSQKAVKQGTFTDSESLFQFSEPLQVVTGVKATDSLSNLEFALRFFLRNNSRVLVNSYEFSDNPLLCDIFKSTQIKYLDIQSFIIANSKKVT